MGLAQRAARGSALMALGLLAACAPDLGPAPSVSRAESYETARSFAAPEANWPEDRWWTAYGDAQLDGLIAEALAGAPDLKIAEARMRQAQAAAQTAGAATLPSLNADGSVLATKQSLNTGFPDEFKDFLPRGYHNEGRATVSLAYQLDFFGKNAAALAAATSDAEAAAVDAAAARIQLSTAVAAAYAELARLGADRAAAADAVRLRRESADLVADRVAHDLENRGQLAQAKSDVAAAEADLAAIDGDVARARNAISALLGKGPDRGLDLALPERPQLRPFGLPHQLAADLIGRRPDIVAARLRAEAASKRIDVAHADFYPNVDLTGYLGLQSLGLKDFFSADSGIGQFGPAVHLPIFDGGRIEGSYRGARASYDEAVALYDKTLTGALRDVADALAGQQALEAELSRSKQALGDIEEAYRIARERYRAGLSRYLDVITVEDKLVAQRRRVANLEAALFAQDVALVRALGGGFASKA